MGRLTKGALSSKPLNPSRRAAVSPAKTARGPALSSAARSVCRSLSGPDCATITPRLGFCQRPDDTRHRTCASARYRSAIAVVRTPSWSSITASRSRLGCFMRPGWHYQQVFATNSFGTVDNPVDKYQKFALTSSRKLNPWPFRRDSDGFAMDLFDLGVYMVIFRVRDNTRMVAADVGVDVVTPVPAPQEFARGLGVQGPGAGGYGGAGPPIRETRSPPCGKCPCGSLEPPLAGESGPAA
jgi:hypothetical protein